MKTFEILERIIIETAADGIIKLSGVTYDGLDKCDILRFMDC